MDADVNAVQVRKPPGLKSCKFCNVREGHLKSLYEKIKRENYNTGKTRMYRILKTELNRKSEMAANHII